MAMPKNRISTAVIHEVYCDLWGYTENWIDAIFDAIAGFRKCETQDVCELYKNIACMAVRFQSTDQSRVERVRSILRRLTALAEADLHRRGETADQIQYSLRIG